MKKLIISTRCLCNFAPEIKLKFLGNEKKVYSLSIYFSVIFLMTLSVAGFAQGVTSANIAGLITDDKGEPLIGATVVAVHEPSGSQYGTSTREDGRFTIPNVRIGGPYTITVNYVGYKNYEEKRHNPFIGQTPSI